MSGKRLVPALLAVAGVLGPAGPGFSESVPTFAGSTLLSAVGSRQGVLRLAQDAVLRTTMLDPPRDGAPAGFHSDAHITTSAPYAALVLAKIGPPQLTLTFVHDNLFWEGRCQPNGCSPVEIDRPVHAPSPKVVGPTYEWSLPSGDYRVALLVQPQHTVTARLDLDGLGTTSATIPLTQGIAGGSVQASTLEGQPLGGEDAGAYSAAVNGTGIAVAGFHYTRIVLAPPWRRELGGPQFDFELTLNGNTSSSNEDVLGSGMTMASTADDISNAVATMSWRHTPLKVSYRRTAWLLTMPL